MSLGSEAEILEVARLPTCYQCRATFSSHFFLFCSVCNRHYCCVCVYSNLLCGCDRTRMSKVETKVKYNLDISVVQNTIEEIQIPLMTW